MSSGHEAAAGPGGQSFYETIKDREVELFGVKGLVRDLVEMCPVKDDPSRMTAEAMDRVAAEAWVLGGNELPEEFQYLVAEDGDKAEQHSPADKHVEKTAPEKDARQNEKTTEKPGLDQVSLAEVEQEHPSELNTVTEHAIRINSDIAGESQAKTQEDVAAPIISVPDEAQLEAVVHFYDELYADEQRSRYEEQAAPTASYESIAVHDDTSDSETVREAAETYSLAVHSEPEAQEQFAVADNFELPAVVAASETAAEYEESSRELEIPDAAIQVEAVQSDGVIEDMPDVEAEMYFPSEFSAEEAAELDEQLGFDIPPSTAAEADNADAVESKSTQTDFVEIVRDHIEALPEEKAEEAQEAYSALQKLEELAVRVAELQLAAEQSPEETERLQQEMIGYAREILIILGKDPSDRMARRFVERIIQSEICKQLQNRELAAERQGTHENKHFLDNLRWLSGDKAKADLVLLVGGLTLRQVRQSVSL